MSLLPEHCRLNEREHSYRYQLIVADQLIDNAPSSHPGVVFLCGQPGSGKTKLRELATEEFSSMVINADDLREYHPMYQTLKLAEPERASFLVNEDVSLWTRKLIRQTVEERRNIVFDGTFGSSDTEMIVETLSLFRNNGYETQLWALAVPSEFSKLGIYLRNEMQIKQTGSGRFVSMKVHDLNYKNIPSNIEMAVKNSLVDQVHIFKRLVEQVNDRLVNNHVHAVHSFGKADAGFENAADIFLQVRDEPMPTLLKNYFSIRFNEVVSLMDERLNNALKTNDVDKVKSMNAYKDQFLIDLGMNEKCFQKIEL